MLRKGPVSIRSLLLVSFLLIALVPLAAISASLIVVSYLNDQQQVFRQLETAADLSAFQIQTWADAQHAHLSEAINETLAPERASVVLEMGRTNRYYDTYINALRSRMAFYTRQYPEILQLDLVDLQGEILVSTSLASEGQQIEDADLLAAAQHGPAMRFPFDPAQAPGAPILAAIPVASQADETRIIGVLLGRITPQAFAPFLGQSAGLQGSEAIFLVNEELNMLDAARLQGDAVEPVSVFASGIGADLQQRASGSGIYRNHRGDRVLGVYRWLPELGVGLVVEQGWTQAFRAILTGLTAGLLIVFVTILLSTLLSLLVVRFVTRPLDRLVETTGKIAAGDLSLQAPAGRTVEFGALAERFNEMTARIRALVGGLEQRVAERTQALQEANQTLQKRALQLETSAQVSREVTAILDVDRLLAQVVALIRFSFDYYRVMVYLLEPDSGMLALKANSGPDALAEIRLPLGPGSLNGQAAAEDRALLANDVLQDERFKPDPKLPDTRAELVIPLRAGGEVIGTLDIHSANTEAFTPDDLLLMQSLGDQIAIAIENARLHGQSRRLAVLEERNRLARELHDSVTQLLYSLRLLVEGWRGESLPPGDAPQDYLARQQDYLARTDEIAQSALKEMRLLIFELRPPLLEEEGLVGALQQRLDAVEKRSGVEAWLTVEGVVELPAGMEDELYRICQEALNNALKHAGAGTVLVSLRVDPGQVMLTIQDNGCGFDPDAARQSGGMGMESMQVRAGRLGGTVVFDSTPGEGTRVRVRIPR